jgi:hypothetical protein
MADAGKILPAGELLYLYGPFLQEGKPTAASNLAFDTSLRDRNPEWGLRSLETVAEVAEKAGFKLREVIEMPANNLCSLESALIFLSGNHIGFHQNIWVFS